MGTDALNAHRAATMVRLPWWKLLAVWALFVLLHFSYETFPNLVFKIIGEQGETIFFHMKMLFWAYVLVSLVELAVRRGRVSSATAFLTSRALIAVAYPWLTITMWFTLEAVGVRLPIIPWEIVYANILTVLGIYVALRLEEVFDAVAFRPALSALVAVMFATAVLSYTAFSLNTPVHFFTTPP
jgi:hypothetical protein